LGFRRVLVVEQPAQCGGNDLPRHAVSVGQPAAAVFLAVGGQLLPQRVDFLLGLAVDEERDRRREGELRATVERMELLPFDLEDHGHRASLRPGARFAVTRDLGDLRILEDRGVELRGLFGLAVEPQEWRYFLHRLLLASLAGEGNQPALRRLPRGRMALPAWLR